jgi:hypothetical protein
MEDFGLLVGSIHEIPRGISKGGKEFSAAAMTGLRHSPYVMRIYCLIKSDSYPYLSLTLPSLSRRSFKLALPPGDNRRDQN